MEKRNLAVILALALALPLCACAPKAGAPSAPPSDPPVTQGSGEAPSSTPSEVPSEEPSEAPSEEPSEEPSQEPSQEPSEESSVPPIVMPDGHGPQEPVDETVLAPSGVGEGDVDLHVFMDELFPAISEYEFPELELMSDERLIHEYPGLGAVPVKQRLIYTPMMSGVACEFAFVEVEDEADVDKVNAIFQERIHSQIDGGAFYLPMIEQWENNARIFTGGKYVILAVHEMSEYMVDADFPLELGLG